MADTEGQYSYRFPRPAVTVDMFVYSPGPPEEVLLVQRSKEPFKGKWCLPGGFLDMDETLEEAAARELAEETGLTGIAFAQVHTFSAVDRDPRGRTITTVFLGTADAKTDAVIAADDAADARWFALDELPELGFDHEEIIARVCRQLREAAH